MLARAGLPLGARLWTFGSPRHADGDGWLAEHGGAAAGHGFLTITPEAGVVEIVSPGDLGVPRTAARAVVLGLPEDARVRAVEVLGLSGSDPAWQRLARVDDAKLQRRDAGRVVALPVTRGAPIDRLKIRIELDAGDALLLTRVAVLP